MAQKVKSYCKYKQFIDERGEKHTVLVYGELTLEKGVFGYRQSKTLNFGYALCSANDEFDVEVGKKIARKRFYTDPLGTFNHNFLNDDMVNAILDNEVNYIIKHIDKYLPEY